MRTSQQAGFAPADDLRVVSILDLDPGWIPILFRVRDSKVG